ncbi:MAG: translation initiation factor IF-2 [Geminicoccaceae bacterium]
MSDAKGQDRNTRIELGKGSAGGRLELKKAGEQGTVRQSFSHGRSKAVAVEVKRRRGATTPVTTPRPAATAPAESQSNAAPAPRPVPAPTRAPAEALRQQRAVTEARGSRSGRGPMVLPTLTEDEKRSRLRALAESKKIEEEARARAAENARRAAEEAARRKADEDAAAQRKAEEEARRKVEEDARKRAEEQAARLLAEEEKRRAAAEAQASNEAAAAPAVLDADGELRAPEESKRGAKAAARQLPIGEDEEGRGKGGKGDRRNTLRRTERDTRRNDKRLILTTDEEAEEIERTRSLAALKRQRERERRQQSASGAEPAVREVVVPEMITVQDLAARMAVRGAEVVKVLMRNGIMVTINQTIDADTAELVLSEFGQAARRVSESDVEIGLEGPEDDTASLQPRAPVVTVMGHVDHGKTSLLDALRQTDVVAGEAGGITQHIGAYQVTVGNGARVTFVDTPGHAAFTAMRARGASITDIVVLVVAADDGVMPQTIEAIRHAKAAKVPIVVAVNKIDKPEANPDRVKQELLSHDVVVEDFGGDVLCVPVSALQKTGLDKLVEQLQLQAELLELKANPDREARGAVVEARLDRGRGVVATVLVQNGTLNQGDIVVAGASWGRVRSMSDDRGETIKSAGPSVPVEIQGLDDVPEAGDQFVVVENEKRARDIADYRIRKRREQQQLKATPARSSLEEMFSQLKSGEIQSLPVVVKSDVHGSLEAIQAGLEKIGNEEASVRVLYGGVGGITESDVTLAQASQAVIIGFNVRANAQARDLAKREGIEIRYYSIIYELLDEMKGLLEGMLAPEAKESILGHAEIREVFNVSKVGKVAGCRVVDGLIRRGGRARLLRDDVVVFDGQLGSLKRFKDDVREVREGFECGMSIEGYNDIRQGDLIEVYEVQEVARTL